MESLQQDYLLSTDHAVLDWSGARPVLRRDLRFHFQDDHGRPVYVIEDLANRRYLQVGIPEYQFIRGLDGKKTAAMLLAENARKNEEDALSENETISILRWLLDQQLLEPDSTDQSNRRHVVQKDQPKKKKSKGVMSLLFHRIPLGNPDRLLSVLAKLFGWTISKPAFAIWLILMGYGVYLGAENWRGLAFAGGNAVLPSNWLLLLVVFVALKLIHEVWHGIATKRFGGVVPEWGVQLIIVTPLTYVDASSSWSFASRWHRWVVAAAGMYVELAVAVGALILWTRTEAGFLNSLAANIVIAASTITLLFNANPLMRFDGYYMLSDALGIKNLGTKGSSMLNWLGKTILMGIKHLPLPPGTRKHVLLIASYGVAAGVWKVLLTTGILIMVSALFKGVGMVIAIAAVSSMILLGVTRFIRYLISRENGLQLRSALPRLALLLAVVGSVLWFVRVQPAPMAPAVVEFPEKKTLRVECPGFVKEIAVKDGDVVSTGDLLIVMENREEVAKLKKLELEAQRGRLESLLLFRRDDVGLHEAANERVEGLEERSVNQEDRVGTLIVKAPFDGVVSAKDLEGLRDRYLTTGDALLTVVPDAAPRVVISASQENLRSLAGSTSRQIRVRLPGRRQEMQAMLERVESRATTALPHPALAASHGGPLPVRQTLEKRTDRQRGLASDTYEQESLSHFIGLDRTLQVTPQELIEARFAAYARLIANEGETSLREGEWGYVRLSGDRDMRLGAWVYYHLYEALIDKMDRAKKGPAA